MRTYFLVLLLCLFSGVMNAQQSATELAKELNKYITLYSSDNASLLTLYEQIGTIEQKANNNAIKRIRLADIGFIKTQQSEGNYVVTFGCADSTQCINLIKSDMMSSPMPGDAFFFTEATAANLFAKKLEELIAKYPSGRTPLKAELLKGAEPDMAVTKPSPTIKKQVIEKEEEDEETSAVEEKITLTPAERQVANKEKMMQKRKPREEKEDTTSDEEEKIDPRDRRELAEDKNATDDFMEPVCKQLMSIMQSGKNTGFNDIEGKETNSTTKINDSKVKLQGAKRSYLSWYKKQRAFIAEYKTSSDIELILMEFERIQTELEDCLIGPWDDIDHSTDAMYANATEEIKDVEYKLNSDTPMPSLRIMINTDASKKHTLFVRIQ